MISASAALAALAGSELLQKVLSPLAEKLGAELKDVTAEKWRKYAHSFERYLKDIENRHKYFSSQIFSNEGQLLENYYVPLTLEKYGPASRKKVARIDSYPADLLRAYKDILIVDTAGMGKSTLLKFMFLQSLKSGEYIPIFIELRKLSREKTILGFVSDELNFAKDPISEKLLSTCLDDGLFTFYLDGFDEIPDDDKRVVSAQIVDLKLRANRNRFVLSSREEQSLASLSEFHKFGIKPLSKDEAFTLIRKISPDTKIALSLIEKIQSQPTQSLTEFLTNPLLVSLLVKSFLHSPILPVRLSEFYRQVFDALFQAHDAKKELGGFTRKKRCNLDLDRFHRTLRALGVLTYRANKLEFSTDELALQIERSKELTSETGYSANSFQHDLLHAVPLFVREGAVIRWAHRSLQEYFAAAYICVDAKENQSKLLLQLYQAGVQKNANLLRLCADIDGKTFKHVLVKRYLAELLQKVDERFNSELFPNIAPELLKQRRAVILDRVPEFMYFQRSVSRETAVKKCGGLLDETTEHGLLVFFDAAGSISNPEGPVRSLIRFELELDNVMNSIIMAYFGVDIVVRPELGSHKNSFKNLPAAVLMRLDSDPNNPVNSASNFKLIVEIFNSLGRVIPLVYSRERIDAILKGISENEISQGRLEINFS